MLRQLVIFSILMIFAFAACATVSPVTPRVNNRKGVDCEEIFITGSRIPETVCWTAQQRKERTAEDQNQLERIQRSTRAPKSN